MKRRVFVGLMAAGLAYLKTSAQKSPQEELSSVVTGRVVDIQGRPAAVSLYLTPVDFRDKNPPIEGHSDSEGHFALKGLPSTLYLLHVTLVSPDVRKTPFFFPGVTYLEKAAVIRLAPGLQVSVADFRFVIYGFKGTTYWLGAGEGEMNTVSRKIILDSDISGIELTLRGKD
jgi:hypothetical protein